MAMVMMFPSCACNLSNIKIDGVPKCLDELAKVASSPGCIDQCINANWVGCAMGCGMAILKNDFPSCTDALADMFGTPQTAGYGASIGSKDLVCKPDSPEACKQAEQKVWVEFEKVRAKSLSK